MTRVRLKSRTREVFRGIMDTPCWDWQDYVNEQGYGIINLGGKLQKVHRLSYILNRGPIPPGLVIDHLCHTHDKKCKDGNNCPHRRCCNPDHLEPVTQRENCERGRRGKDMQYCAKGGHPLFGDNLYITSVGGRQCKRCLKNSQAELYQQQKAERAAWQKDYYARHRDEKLAYQKARYQSKKAGKLNMA